MHDPITIDPLSISSRVRAYVRTLKPGDRFTNKSVADAIGYKLPIRPNGFTDIGPISGQTFKLRSQGAVKVVKRGLRGIQTFEVINPSLMGDVPDGPPNSTHKNPGHGEGSRRPNRMSNYMPPVHEPLPSWKALAEKQALPYDIRRVNVEVDLDKVLASISIDELLAEIKKRTTR